MSRERKPPADLQALKQRLKEKEEAARKAAPKAPPARRAPAPPPPPTPAAPEPPVSFDDEMKRLGVAPPPGDAGRLRVPPPAAPARIGAPKPEEPELPETLDDEALWALSMRGVTAAGRGVDRGPGERSEALPTLDLHGFSEEDAVHELRRFVQLHRGPRAKWVRVITGRGVHGTGIVKRATLGWLQRNPSIAAFRPAPKEEGGDGVLLVQLTKKTR